MSMNEIKIKEMSQQKHSYLDRVNYQNVQKAFDYKSKKEFCHDNNIYLSNLYNE